MEKQFNISMEKKKRKERKRKEKKRKRDIEQLALFGEGSNIIFFCFSRNLMACLLMCNENHICGNDSH